MNTRLVLPRLPASLLTSAALHALGLALAVHFVGAIRAPGKLPRAEIIPVSLVSLPGGGGGPRGDGKPAPPPPAPPPEMAKPAAPPPPPPNALKRAVKKKPTVPTKVAAETDAQPAPAPVATPAGPAEGAVGQGGGSVAATGSGSGDGSGGDGSGGARPAYGSKPDPPYPPAARRLGLEGRLLLEVVVRADGRVGSVSVRESSGHRFFDDSAVETVRTRWRFIPARRGDVPIESTVTVPILFRMHEG